MLMQRKHLQVSAAECAQPQSSGPDCSVAACFESIVGFADCNGVG